MVDAQSANADATQESADAQSILQDGLGATTDGINEQATALGEVIDALGTYYGFALSSSNALISMHDSFDKATESVQKNGQTLDLNTEQGRANQSALNDLAESALKAAEASHATAKDSKRSTAPLTWHARNTSQLHMRWA